MENLKSIIKEIKSYDFIKPSDDMVLDCAVRIFNSQNIELKKNADKPIKEVLKPTDKQIYFLKKNKIDATNMSRLEASKLIEEIKK